MWSVNEGSLTVLIFNIFSPSGFWVCWCNKEHVQQYRNPSEGEVWESIRAWQCSLCQRYHHVGAQENPLLEGISHLQSGNIRWCSSVQFVIFKLVTRHSKFNLKLNYEVLFLHECFISHIFFQENEKFYESLFMSPESALSYPSGNVYQPAVLKPPAINVKCDDNIILVSAMLTCYTCLHMLFSFISVKQYFLN